MADTFAYPPSDLITEFSVYCLDFILPDKVLTYPYRKYPVEIALHRVPAFTNWNLAIT